MICMRSDILTGVLFAPLNTKTLLNCLKKVVYITTDTKKASSEKDMLQSYHSRPYSGKKLGLKAHETILINQNSIPTPTN